MSRVQVSTPSRLHFGLLRLHESNDRSFGGFGMMIDRPRVELTMTPARDWSVSGLATSREISIALRVLEALPGAVERITALSMHVSSAIPQHRGLGGGTQLSLAIAAGIRELLALPRATPEELAASVGRGQRSAIGTHGFLNGGLIWERGRASEERLASIAERIELPAAWRVLLITPAATLGLHGVKESDAFRNVPPVPDAMTRRLEAIAENHALPAARRGDLEAFGEAVYQYGRLAGECFSPIQGGPYASSEVAACVENLRNLGVSGVGQSSWGPTVFALAPSADSADDLVRRWQVLAKHGRADVTLAAPDNDGAIMSTQPAGACETEVARGQLL
jgi:beta-ribofuranosylaminobenzene 5'-phosphate synthase